MSLGSPIAWPTATPILEHRLIAMDGVRALDHLAQVHYQPNLNHPWVSRLPEIRGLKPADWAQQQRAFEENEERAAVMRLYAAFEGLVRRVSFNSTLLPGRLIIGMDDNQPSGNRNRLPKMSDLDGFRRGLCMFITGHPSNNTHPLTPRPGTPAADVPALTRCPT